MSTKHTVRHQLKQLELSFSTPLIAMAALACAILVETEQLNYTYPLELVLQGIVHDSALLTILVK
ncbi:hypothetical protein MKJ04_07550 [Pontibacter sp. E15-1]|uniref:hypothetical protein n=1 Tax=Pontibacter sp. E15-1 TaxID=2919918 RepID=UPI001F4F6471|nr:hypothetical protein [Pontibacter sp. E15-1]MCJ8164693.1 hypothetical protein [Pontibacter sp. E15-1]